MSDATTQYGFEWGQLEVTRMVEYRGYRVIAVRAGGHELQVQASPTGRALTVYLDGVRMEKRPDPPEEDQ